MALPSSIARSKNWKDLAEEIVGVFQNGITDEADLLHRHRSAFYGGLLGQGHGLRGRNVAHSEASAILIDG